MAPSTLIILLAIFSIYATFQVSSANIMSFDCCLQTNNKVIPQQNVRSYRRQTTEEGCNIEAIVFITRKNKHLCAPPGSQWVKDLMEKVDKKRGHEKKRSH
ncbi:monocyte chemotactic protein 1B-like [Anomaloglossus baeobatrachus]|uniref:monocyte chemotactic protein 1B-like n=1 Tax=Anomaloglossus baeobatrachus TaxID=238106 RepID=UPI003F4F78B0